MLGELKTQKEDGGDNVEISHRRSHSQPRSRWTEGGWGGGVLTEHRTELAGVGGGDEMQPLRNHCPMCLPPVRASVHTSLETAGGEPEKCDLQ